MTTLIYCTGALASLILLTLVFRLIARHRRARKPWSAEDILRKEG